MCGYGICLTGVRCSWIYRTQENWFLALNDDVLEGASDELLTLLGYRTEVLGTVYGRSPR
ncbi:MAG: hypothetical protein OXU70_20690 [Gammaproteobacteria bacterium]|nr:hypothetical protein [Gammaproteobacteria bacterium]